MNYLKYSRTFAVESIEYTHVIAAIFLDKTRWNIAIVLSFTVELNRIHFCP